jgi:hypothetical protein
MGGPGGKSNGFMTAQRRRHDSPAARRQFRAVRPARGTLMPAVPDHSLIEAVVHRAFIASDSSFVFAVADRSTVIRVTPLHGPYDSLVGVASRFRLRTIAWPGRRASQQIRVWTNGGGQGWARLSPIKVHELITGTLTRTAPRHDVVIPAIRNIGLNSADRLLPLWERCLQGSRNAGSTENPTALKMRPPVGSSCSTASPRLRTSVR